MPLEVIGVWQSMNTASRCRDERVSLPSVSCDCNSGDKWLLNCCVCKQVHVQRSKVLVTILQSAKTTKKKKKKNRRQIYACKVRKKMKKKCSSKQYRTKNSMTKGQTEHTQMRWLIMNHLIWICAICKYSFWRLKIQHPRVFLLNSKFLMKKILYHGR